MRLDADGQLNPPEVINTEAHQVFCDQACKMGFDPDSLWVGGYVEYEWTHGRHLLDCYLEHIQDQDVLEFGCNYGATAIILAALGARVTAIDINKDALKLAQLNAERYGLSERINFMHCADTTQLPFDDQTFDLITCNSVLEYVDHQILDKVLKEIDRVLKLDGLLLIYSTSNRLWPKEVHSGKWLINYLPRHFDRFLAKNEEVERGVFPSELISPISSNFINHDLLNGCQCYIDSKEKMGISPIKLAILKLANRICLVFGIPVSILAPNITLIQKKVKHSSK